MIKDMLALALCALAFGAAAAELAIEPSTGSFLVVLEREGPMAALGHDHVLDARDYEGAIKLADASSQVRLTVPVEWLEIDAPQSRAAAGLKGTLSEKVRDKVREQMRGPKGLDRAAYPEIRFASARIEPVVGEKDLWMVTGELSLHGQTRTIEIPVKVERVAEGAWFSGRVRLRPSEYGLKPFSVFGGMVRVKDEALVRFRLFARPL